MTVQSPFKTGQSTTSFPRLSKVQVTATPHSILKKTRGPSTTEPRPNARFASPHESTPDTSTNSSIKVESHNLHDVQPPLPDFKTPKTEKKAQGRRTKKSHFAVSTAKRKNKPAIRRQGPPSSTNTAAKVSNQNEIQTSDKTVLHDFSEVPRNQKEISPLSQENFSPDSLAPQPFQNRRCPKPAETNEAVALGEPGRDELDKLELRQEEANVFVENQHQTSQNLWNGGLLVLQEEGETTLCFTASLTTLTDAIGHPHLSDSTIPALPQVTSTKDEGQWKGDETKDINQVAVFAKIPVLPISAHKSAGSLVGKSQLTLLLEKDSAKKGV